MSIPESEPIISLQKVSFTLIFVSLIEYMDKIKSMWKIRNGRKAWSCNFSKCGFGINFALAGASLASVL